MRTFIVIMVSVILSLTTLTFSGVTSRFLNNSVSNKTEPAPAVKKIKVALWDYDVTEYDQKMIDAYQKRNPHTQIEVVSIPSMNYSSKLSIMLAVGENIDVFYTMNINECRRFASRNNIAPIDDWMERDHIDLKPYGDATGESLKAGNNICGLPYRRDFYTLFYNKNIFDRNHIPYPTNDMTWSEFREIGKKLTNGEGDRKTYGIFMDPFILNYSVPIMQKLTNADLMKYDFYELKPAIELFMNVELLDKSAVDYITNKSLQANQRTFEKGNSAMYVNGTWFMNYLASDRKAGKIDFDWGMVRLPHWEGMETPSSFGHTFVSINSTTSKPEEAWDFVKFITGKAGAQILANELMLPAYIDEDILTQFDRNSQFPNGVVEVIKAEMANTPIEPGRGMDWLQGIVIFELEMILTRSKTVDQGIADMIKRRNEIIGYNNSKKN